MTPFERATAQQVINSLYNSIKSSGVQIPPEIKRVFNDHYSRLWGELPQTLPATDGENRSFGRGMIAGACFSPDKTYRFALWRRWDLSLPMAMFIGLNPSTANEKRTDPTITRLVGIPGKPGLAARNGFGGFYMMNLYPFVTPYPGVLEIAPDKLPENDLHLYQVSLQCDTIVFCWGNFNTFGRDAEVMQMFTGAKCFGKNKSGSPKHPLYLAGNTKFRAF